MMQPPPVVRAANREARTVSGWAAMVLLLVFLMALWLAVAASGQAPPYTLPAPHEVLDVLLRHFGQSGDGWPHAAATLLSAAAGLAIALAIAAALTGAGTFQHRFWHAALVVIAIPALGLATIVIVWWGFGWPAGAASGALMALVPAFLGFASEGPVRAIGIALGAPAALHGALAGEMIGSQTGLGHLMIEAMYTFDTAKLFVLVLFVTALGVAGAAVAHAVVAGLRRDGR